MIQKRQKHANAGNEKREGGTTCRLSCSGSNTPLVGLLLGTSDSRFDLRYGQAQARCKGRGWGEGDGGGMGWGRSRTCSGARPSFKRWSSS